MALRSIGDAVIATGPDGRILFVNPVAEQLTGWSEAEARGRELTEVFNIVNERSRLPVENPVDKVLREGRAVGLANHTVLISRDGAEKPIDDSAAPIIGKNGELEGVILVFRDVTEKRLADLANERLAAVVESSDDVIVTKDLNGIITSWNKGAERVLGYTPEEVIGKHVSMLMPPDVIEDTELILGHVAQGQKVDHYQTRRRRKDGTIIDVSLTVSPIRSPEGEVVGASKVGRDITVEKQLERERAEGDRRKDEFLAMLAHELRNPVASIDAAVRLFGRLKKPEELEWAKHVVLRQVKHLARLIDDLLDISRITQGKIELQREPLDLLQVVNSAVETVRPLIEERKHELTVSLASGSSHLEADPVRLEQILVNLLMNAAKYTDAGGHIWVTAKAEGDTIFIRVKDNGRGLAPDLLPHLFELFVQGNRSAARSEGGLGIGLTLVKSLTELHGGSVSAASGGPGQGSEFTLRLPAYRGAVIPQKRVDPAPEMARHRARVLVVDDNVDTATALSKLLQLLGHDVDVAHDGLTAMQAAKKSPYDVVLLDIGLPGMTGYEVAKELRRETNTSRSVIVAISGYGQEEDMRRSLEAGFDRHLVKPVEYEQLLTLVESK